MPEETMNTVWLGTGRRKTSIARVRIVPGNGHVIVNGRAADEYFQNNRSREYVRQPLQVSQQIDAFDVKARVNGGGLEGQAGALVLGIARALVKAVPDTEQPLRDAGLLTRDGRMKERKKYGKKGARASFQFSKR